MEELWISQDLINQVKGAILLRACVRVAVIISVFAFLNYQGLPWGWGVIVVAYIGAEVVALRYFVAAATTALEYASSTLRPPREDAVASQPLYNSPAPGMRTYSGQAASV
ncbi:MAG: hypothetical protein QOE68_3583 [Thermoanaerobaculia bacterium]|jgi:hypothetical protein|nr:hypothetical protein [Thermoanaerobaculia bacterium]